MKEDIDSCCKFCCITTVKQIKSFSYQQKIQNIFLIVLLIMLHFGLFINCSAEEPNINVKHSSYSNINYMHKYIHYNQTESMHKYIHYNQTESSNQFNSNKKIEKQLQFKRSKRSESNYSIGANKLIRDQIQIIEFLDSNANQYKKLEFNICPAQCSCLNDYFECRKRNLKRVPQLPDWVQKLDLTGNKLDDNIEISIGNLSQLISLTIKRNRLNKIPVLKRLNKLEELNLSNNRIQAVTIEPFLSMINLKILDISRNAIRTILPNSFPTKNRLTSLNLNFNQITSLGENSFDVLKDLIELQLNKNGLTILPNGIFKSLNHLKRLSLSENNIQFSWSTFKGLNNLRVLKLKSNGISDLSDGVFHTLKSIESIDLDSNQIKQMNRKGLYNLSTLTALTLSNNSIETIELNAFEFTQNLQIIDLSHNNLIELKTTHFQCLNNLKQLNLNNNRLKFVTNTNMFGCIQNLEILDLSNNQLSWLIEDVINGPFKLFKNLLKLNLAGNSATLINQKTFHGLEQLQILNLNYNNFTTVQFNAFSSLHKLQKLIINTEHLICDCNLKWFYNWLKGFIKKHKIIIHSSISGSNVNNMNSISLIIAKCDYPNKLFGKDLLKLKSINFMCDQSPKPQIIKEPSNQLIIKGNNATLKCTAVSSLLTEIQIQWRRNNIYIRDNHTKNETQILNENNSTITTSYLHLYNVSHSQHTGKYQCVVTNSFGTAYSQKFKISVSSHPEFRKIPTNVTIQSGYTARLDCSAFGDPKPEIAWQKDGGNDFPAARERRMHVMSTDDAFFIINAKTIDMGVYTCTAENLAGVIKANATLIVNEAPLFVTPVEIVKEVLAGESCVLECLSTGSPKPTLNWYKDDKLLKLSERHIFTADQQLLIIANTKFSDSGQYACEIENSLGRKTSKLILSVIPGSVSKNIFNIEEMSSIVIIAVLCCTIGTSVIWLVIIYQTKKLTAVTNNSNNTLLSNSNTDRHCVIGTSNNVSCGNINNNSSLSETNFVACNNGDSKLYRSIATSIQNHKNQHLNGLSIFYTDNIPKNKLMLTKLSEKKRNSSFICNIEPNADNHNNEISYSNNTNYVNSVAYFKPQQKLNCASTHRVDNYCNNIPKNLSSTKKISIKHHQITFNDIFSSPIFLEKKRTHKRNSKSYLNNEHNISSIKDHSRDEDDDIEYKYHIVDQHFRNDKSNDGHDNAVIRIESFDKYCLKLSSIDSGISKNNCFENYYSRSIPNLMYQCHKDKIDNGDSDNENDVDNDLTHHLYNSSLQLDYNVRRCDGYYVIRNLSLKSCKQNHKNNYKSKHKRFKNQSIKSKPSTPSSVPPPLPLEKKCNEDHKIVFLIDIQKSNNNNSINDMKNITYINNEYRYNSSYKLNDIFMNNQQQCHVVPSKRNETNNVNLPVPVNSTRINCQKLNRIDCDFIGIHKNSKLEKIEKELDNVVINYDILNSIIPSLIESIN